MSILIVAAAGLLVGSASITAAAQEAPGQAADVRAVLARPVVMERAVPVTSTRIETRYGKLFLQATVNGQSREFIFDTGSPTVLTREFADELGLEIVGENVGVDANGTQVTMDVAVLESVAIGDTIFRRVPVLIHDYAALGMGHCFLDGGMLGSELLPGSAWRIDTEEQRLTVAEHASALGGGTPAIRATLHKFGYPHYPIVDYSIGELSDKAIFDTGNSEQVTLFRGAAESRPVRDAVLSDSLSTGRGSEGESAGGRGTVTELVRFSLSDFGLGGHSLGPLRATTRAVPPTLIGAGILASHIVTLDYPGAQLLLERRNRPAAPKFEAGYSIAFDGDHAKVVQLFEDSPAFSAGLRLGDRVLELQGRSLEVTPANERCASARWLAESFEPSNETEVVVERGSGPMRIRLPAAAGTATATD